METIEKYTGKKREDFIEEIELNLENKCVCSVCGAVTEQKNGMATSSNGFRCFNCI
jgi:hypothetical protein